MEKYKNDTEKMFDRAAKQGHNLSGICNVEKLGPPKEIFVDIE